MSHCPLLHSTIRPNSVSTSHCTVCCFFLVYCTLVFYSLCTVCYYIALYPLLVLGTSHCIFCLFWVLHIVSSVCSVSLCPMLSLAVCPLCEYPVHYSLLFCVTVSLCPLLSSKISALSVRISHFTACWFCDPVFTAAFYSLSYFCHYLSLYHKVVLFHYVHSNVAQSLQFLLVPQFVPSVCSMSLRPLLSSAVGLLYHCLI